MAATRSELVAHVGGNPSPGQRAIIKRAARLALYIELMDAKALPAGGMSERDSRQYLAWSNSFIRAVRELGRRGAVEKAVPSIADIAARHATAKAPA